MLRYFVTIIDLNILSAITGPKIYSKYTDYTVYVYLPWTGTKKDRCRKGEFSREKRFKAKNVDSKQNFGGEKENQ